MKLSKNFLDKFPLTLFIVLSVLGSVVLAFNAYELISRNLDLDIDKSTYQAVFLTNDQVYFGLLKNINSPYPVLSDVYYVKLEGGSSSQGGQSTAGKLVKLGQDEAHGPRDAMILNKDHILFWENLRTDSQIVQLIAKMKAGR